MKAMSLKKHVILNFALSIGIEALEKNKLIVVTSAGVFTGKLNKEDKEDNSNHFFSILLEKITDNFEGSLSNLAPDDGYIVLKEAMLNSGGIKYNISRIVIFYDQIVGITIGDLG